MLRCGPAAPQFTLTTKSWEREGMTLRPSPIPRNLNVEWVHQKFHRLSVVETSPVVLDGLMFITSRAIVMGATSR